MRVGVSSRGKWWVSMGPVGWLIVGPFILAFYAVIGVVWFLIFLVKFTAAAVTAIRDR